MAWSRSVMTAINISRYLPRELHQFRGHALLPFGLQPRKLRMGRGRGMNRQALGISDGWQDEIPVLQLSLN